MGVTGSGKSLLRLESVRREFGDVVALAECDLTLDAGQVTVVVGPNGAGKTTLLHVMAGLVEPTHGTVWVGELDASTARGRRALRQSVAHAGDLAVLYPELTVQDHLELVAVAYGLPDARARVEVLLDAFGLDPRRAFLPHELSAGMRQKLQLAAAFVRPSRVLLLDEPTRALDRTSRAALWGLVADAREQGCAVVVVTHDAMPASVADRALVVEDGVVVRVGSAQLALDHIQGDANAPGAAIES
ncbi:MAG: ABC-2 type transport system ATP-binding protein [Glaciecola sp.]|jgi:ABC-2 type transport system ATP-binding protein